MMSKITGQKMDNKLSYLKVISLNCILLVSLFVGCIEQEQKSGDMKETTPEVQLDQLSVLPDWVDGGYHDYYGTMQTLNDFNDKFPDLVDVFSIGESVLGKDIWCIRITNEKNNCDKYSCLIDGCIHGNEWEAGEACLYLADFLFINFGKNETVTNILNTSNVYIVPLLNPDGRDADERWNNNGIDLNRNFDVHFGRLRSGNYPLGKLFGFIKIPMIRHPLRKNKVLGEISTNCGRRAFSEPETQAIRDLMESLDRYSFYVNCHTAVHVFAAQGDITYKPEFAVTNHERKITNTAVDWVTDNTEYYGIRGEEFKHTGIGCASDWVYSEFGIASFCFEMLSQDYEPWYGHGRHDGLVHWMKTTLPVFIYLLANIENLHDWKTPDIKPSLPVGVPPIPLG
jgi:carboxypeptidase T